MSTQVDIAVVASQQATESAPAARFELPIELVGIVCSSTSGRSERRALALSLGVVVFDGEDGAEVALGILHRDQLVTVPAESMARLLDDAGSARVVATRFRVDAAVVHVDEQFEAEVTVGRDAVVVLVVAGEDVLSVPLLDLQIACRQPPVRCAVGALIGDWQPTPGRAAGSARPHGTPRRSGRLRSAVWG